MKTMIAAALSLICAGNVGSVDISRGRLIPLNTKLNDLHGYGAMLLVKQDIPFPPYVSGLPKGYPKVVFHYNPHNRKGEILNGMEALKVTDDDPNDGDSWCELELNRSNPVKDPDGIERRHDPEFALHEGDGIVLMEETKDSPDASGYTLAVKIFTTEMAERSPHTPPYDLAVESSIIKEFGCYMIATTEKAKEGVNAGLMRKHVGAILNLGS